MTSTCPAGHASQSGDYCDLCGRKMTAPAVADPSAPEPSAADTSGTTDQALSGWPDTLAPEVAAGGEPCPLCGSPRPGTDRYCEACGHDFVAEAAGASDPPASSTPPSGDPIVPSRWEATVFADRAHYDRVGTKDTPFPMHCPERQFVIEDRQVRIGRRSASRGVYPEIDLSGAPVDTAISHLQAVLIRQPGGTYDLIDPGSMNGTTLNEDAAPIPVDKPVPVNDGDQIHIGAWTTITVHACSRSAHGKPATQQTDEPVEGETAV